MTRIHTFLGGFIVALLMSSSLLMAQKTVDARLLFTQINAGKDIPNAQVNSFMRSMMLRKDMTSHVFESQDRYLSLSHFPLPGNESATLVLERTAAVFDANTEFYTHTKAGKVPIRVRPIISYRGTINGDKATSVSLHYSEGNLTGFVRMADGNRTVIGRDFALERTAGGTPHVIADEKTMNGIDPLSKFVCGDDLLPEDTEARGRFLSTPLIAKTKSVEQTQADYLREFRIAMVLREDIDSVMKRRGDTDEEIVQYFMKIVAAMAQPYEQELNAMIYVGYFEKFTKDEPSGLVSDGSDMVALLREFSAQWSSRASYDKIKRSVAHLYTISRRNGSNIGGIAYRAQMCNNKNFGGYGVSAVRLDASEIPGSPNRANGYVWDVMVGAHEMGHNIGSIHTFSCDWNPALDTCILIPEAGDACYLPNSGLRRVVPGTIMSYCHLVNNETTPLIFGDVVAAKMRGFILAADTSCMPYVAVPTVQITEPRGSDSYNVDEKMTIRWASARVSNVNISWGASQSGPWTQIASNIDAADRQYLWTVTAQPAPQFWIRVEDATNASVNDTSLASYRVAVPVVLDAPKGGERIGGGSAFTIRWTKGAGIGNVKIEFAPDGATFETLVASLSATSYAWTVPSITTENARIRASAVSAPTVPSTSGAFAIGVRRYALEIPFENASLCKNQLNQYRWSADFIPTIRIQYSTDDGANWRSATQQSTIDASVWQVFSRNINMSNVPKGTKLKLRVVDAVTEEVLDTRNNLTMDSCDAPVSVSEVSGEVPFSITSISPNPASSVLRIGVASNESRQYDVILMSAEGRELVLRSDLSIASGSSTVEVPLNNVAAGAYRIVIRGDGMQAVAPVMIVR